jgi:hypothetical protein
MDNIQAHELVTGTDIDLKTMFIFFKLYVTSCRKLKAQNVTLNNSNIKLEMKSEFDIWKDLGLSKLLISDDFKEAPLPIAITY